MTAPPKTPRRQLEVLPSPINHNFGFRFALGGYDELQEILQKKNTDFIFLSELFMNGF